MTQPRELVAFAEAAVDQVDELFRSGLGAPPAHFKGEGDFVTEVDLQIEQKLRLHLTQLTGIEVYGEESTSFGGDDAAEFGSTMWVVDPIDGTANYSAGNPLCGILVSLIHEGTPVVAVADFPLLGRRLVAADGMQLRSIGGPATGFGEARGHVGCSSHLPTDIFDEIRETGLRPRMTGSVGVDSAFLAQGVFDGVVNFSPHPWDNAAGALLIKAAGGIATDPEGNEWTLSSRGLVAGTPQVHATLLDIVARHR